MSSRIRRTQLKTGSADHVLINDGSGRFSSEAQLAYTRGGTGHGATPPANGNLLIGNGTDFTLTTLSQDTNLGVTISNGSGSIALGTVQDIRTSAAPTFAQVSVTNAPVNPTDTVNLAYANLYLSHGISWKNFVRVATTVPLSDIDYPPGYISYTATATTLTATTSGAFPQIDGISLSSGDSILVKDETGILAPNNGIYTLTSVGDIYTPWVLTRRSPDCDTASMLLGAEVIIDQGIANSGRGYWQQTPAPITLGVTDIVWVWNFGSSLYTADETTLTRSGTVFSIKPLGITNSLISNSAAISYSKLNLSGSIVNSDISLSASIAYSKLNLSASVRNSDIDPGAAIAYSKLNLNHSIVDSDVSNSAAISYNKLNLSTSIVNADISTIAAISYSKLNLNNSIVNADINVSAAIAYSKLNLATSIVNADINASAAIAYSKLNLTGAIVNSDISGTAAIVYSKLSLSNSIVNADINASAAIAYSKLSLSNSIVNADINTSAAISYSKLNLANGIVNNDINASAAIAYSKLNLSTSISRGDLNVSGTTGTVVVAKLIAGTNITLSSTGTDSGTGDVTINASGTISSLGTINEVTTSVSGNTTISSESFTISEFSIASGVEVAINSAIEWRLI